MLDAEASKAVRDKLVGEIAVLGSAEAAIEWAGRSLGAKNTLTAEDARAVEAAFRDRMQVLEPETSSPNTVPPGSQAAEAPPQPGSASPADPAAPAEVPGPVRELPKQRKRQGSRISIEGVDGVALVQPRRCRDKHHLRFITVQPCTVCGRQPCEAHHLRFAQPRALGRKVPYRRLPSLPRLRCAKPTLWQISPLTMQEPARDFGQASKYLQNILLSEPR